MDLSNPDEIRNIIEQAPPGPWVAVPVSGHGEAFPVPRIVIAMEKDLDYLYSPLLNMPIGAGNTLDVKPVHTLIAAAPESAAEVARLREELDSMRRYHMTSLELAEERLAVAEGQEKEHITDLANHHRHVVDRVTSILDGA